MDRFIVVVLFSLIPFTVSAEDFRARLHQVHSPLHSQLDVSAEIEFGRKVAAHLLGRERLLTEPDLTRYVNLVGKSLALHAPRTELEFRFGILNSEAVNAYSTPGGYVFITAGALNLAQDESELAAVLAHEIAHINSRHIVKELNIRGTKEADQISAIARIVNASNDATRVAANQALDSAMILLFNQGYKIKDEMEADQRAMLLLAATGYDPMALPRYLKRVDEYMAVNPNQKTRTHPSSELRFSRMKQLAAEERLVSTQRARVKDRYVHHTSKD